MSIGAKPWEGSGGGASVPDASETTAGKIRIATSTEAGAGTDDLTAMTPLTVKERIDAALVGGVEYKGTFNATAGTPSLATAEKGDLYIVGTAGTIYGQTWAVGDHLLINANMGGSIDNSKIDKVDNTDAVTSVNTQTGAVVLSADDLAADYTPTNYIPSNTNIDGHLEGIDDEFLLTAPLASPAFTGTPTADTAAPGTNTTQLATTAFVTTAVAGAGGISSVSEDTDPTLGGDLKVGGFAITSTSNGDVTLDPDGTGDIVLGADLMPDADGVHEIGSTLNRFDVGHMDVEGAQIFRVRNNSGATLNKGAAVYISGVNGDYPEVSLARANSASTMPAYGLVKKNIGNGATGYIVTFGNLRDHDTSSFSEGDTLYISASTAGALVSTPPTGESNLIQNIGRVVKSHATTGIIKVGGAGRSNATPNLDDGKVFLGDASNQAVSTALSAINLSSFNDDLSSTYQPLDAGLTSISGLTTAANKMIFTDGSDSYATTDLTAFARSLLDDADATTARSTLSLGTAATSDSGDFLASTAAVGDLSDVTITSVSNGQVLSYNSTSGDWENTTPASGGATDLDGLSDVTITSATGGDLLQNNGSGQFVNVAKSSVDVGAFNDDGTYQASDAGLTSISGLTTAANKMIYTTASDTYATADLTAFARSLLDDADATTARSTLSLGTASTEDVGTSANNVIQLDGSARLPAVDGSQLTNLPSGVTELNELSDVTITGAATGEVLRYSGAAWVDAQLAYSDLSGTPTLATVATTGAYSDLSGTPTLATVATTGAYSDLSGTPTLGTAAALDVGTTANDVVQLDGSARLPAVDGSQLTNLPSGATQLNDLSDVTITGASTGEVLRYSGAAWVDATLAYSDLSGTPTLATVATTGAYSDLSGTPTLGTAAALDVGTSASNVVQLDGSARLPAVDGSQLTNLPSGGGGNATLTQETLTADKTISTPSASRTIFVFTSSADRVVNLPAASGLSSGQLVDIKSMSNVTLTITPNGTDNLDGSSGGTLALNVQYSSVTLVCDGTDDWFIV